MYQQEGDVTNLEGKNSEAFFSSFQKVHRDASLAILHCLLNSNFSFCTSSSSELRYLDLFCGNGVRALRFLKEVGNRDGRNATAVGIDSEQSCTAAAERAACANNISSQATFIAYKIKKGDCLLDRLPGLGIFHIIDIDPFGSSLPYIKVSLPLLMDKGFLLLTCTDSRELFSLKHNKFFSTQGVLRPPSRLAPHEFGIRAALTSALLSIVQEGLHPRVICSWSFNHGCRIILQIFHKPPSDCDMNASDSPSALAQMQYQYSSSILRNFSYVCVSKECKIAIFERSREVCKWEDFGKDVPENVQQGWVRFGPIWSAALIHVVLVSEAHDYILSCNDNQQNIAGFKNEKCALLLERLLKENQIFGKGYSQNSTEAVESGFSFSWGIFHKDALVTSSRKNIAASKVNALSNACDFVSDIFEDHKFFKASKTLEKVYTCLASTKIPNDTAAVVSKKRKIMSDNTDESLDNVPSAMEYDSDEDEDVNDKQFFKCLGGIMQRLCKEGVFVFDKLDKEWINNVAGIQFPPADLKISDMLQNLSTCLAPHIYKEHKEENTRTEGCNICSTKLIMYIVRENSCDRSAYDVADSTVEVRYVSTIDQALSHIEDTQSQKRQVNREKKMAELEVVTDTESLKTMKLNRRNRRLLSGKSARPSCGAGSVQQDKNVARQSIKWVNEHHVVILPSESLQDTQELKQMHDICCSPLTSEYSRSILRTDHVVSVHITGVDPAEGFDVSDESHYATVFVGSNCGICVSATDQEPRRKRKQYLFFSLHNMNFKHSGDGKAEHPLICSKGPLTKSIISKCNFRGETSQTSTPSVLSRSLSKCNSVICAVSGSSLLMTRVNLSSKCRGCGVYAGGKSTALLRMCKISRVLQGSGIRCDSGSSLTILQTVINCCGMSGIYVKNSSKVVVKGCTLQKNHRSGIELFSCHSNQVRLCSDDNSVQYASTGVLIDNTEMFDNFSSGLLLIDCFGVYISDSTIYRNKAANISAGQDSTCTLWNVIVQYSHRSGIFAKGNRTSINIIGGTVSDNTERDIEALAGAEIKRSDGLS